MKTTMYSNNNLLFLFLLLGWTMMITLPACDRSDDDNMEMIEPDTTTTMMPVDSFEVSCCDIPPLDVCLGGAYCFVPNAFTPNGDGINDIFAPWVGEGIKEVVDFTVFRPDGGVAFERFNIPAGYDLTDIGWSGFLPNGSNANQVYDYRITIKNIRDEEETFEGQVCSRVDFPLPCIEKEKRCAYGAQHNGLGRFDINLPTLEECQ
ncbi:MAG: hypothetical protein AAFP19_14610 [Bacteroidota bacterium]